MTPSSAAPTRPYDLGGKRVFVAGHRGMVGGAIARRLASERCELLLASHSDLDLTRQAAVEAWFARHKPQAVFLAAARVGGIRANDTYPVDFLADNLAIQSNVIGAAHQTGVEKLLFLGSSCIYPRLAPQPIREEALLTGPLEPTNEWYAIAKIAGIKLVQAHRKQYGADYISAMPTNLYGEGDNFHPENSHVPAALLSRFHAAKVSRAPEVVVWGTGTPLREFLFVDDLADACVHLMKHYSGDSHINVGTGTDLSIADFAHLIAKVVGYEGRLVFDTSRPDGTPRKVMDVSRLAALGWRAPTSLEDGLKRYYAWYLANIDKLRAA
ncbi:MAG: GDP-L-fucose synthase [Hyphomicrobiales bacterium]|nr:MAG: GDP-L-fucose synthase [Hyphomicrobiales bacterium]